MSSDRATSADTPTTRRTRKHRRRGRVFATTFAIVAAVLAVVGLAGAAASVAQGPRVTDVQVDPAAAVAASGSRLIITTSQSLAEVDPSQVSVEPETPFVVDASGRSLGVRFGLPLWEDTEYTVTIDDVQGVGGGPASTITETFQTPAAEVHLLQRSADAEGDDTIFRTDLSGENAVPVFTHTHIEDFRATASHLVISVRSEDDVAALIQTDLDGGDPRELPLPGDGWISQLQSADRGEVMGYTFSDADLGESGGRESMLFTASLKDAAAEDDPTQVRVDGADPRVAEWRFVPDTDSMLLLSFDASLLLTGSGGEGATALGAAIGIDGIARGSSEAVVERPEQLSVVDLTDAGEKPLIAADDDLGILQAVSPMPDGSTIRTSSPLDATGLPTEGTTVSLVGVDGATRVLLEAPSEDAVLQTCVSPSTRYLAVLIAPHAVSNPYDTYQLPLPERLETRVIEIADGSEVVSLAGSSISWCQVPSS
jgi:hypothetical protein